MYICTKQSQWRQRSPAEAGLLLPVFMPLFAAPVLVANPSRAGSFICTQNEYNANEGTCSFQLSLGDRYVKCNKYQQSPHLYHGTHVLSLSLPSYGESTDRDKHHDSKVAVGFQQFKFCVNRLSEKLLTSDNLIRLCLYSSYRKIWTSLLG